MFVLLPVKSAFLLLALLLSISALFAVLRRCWAAPRCFIAGLLLGFIISHYTVVTETNKQLHASLAGADFLVTGTVASVPKHTDRSTRFLFDIVQIDRSPVIHKSNALEQKRQSDEELPKLERVLLSWYGTGRRDVRAGQRWQLLARLKPPTSLGNPGGFDYAAWLFYQRVHASGYVRPKPVAVKLSDHPAQLHALRESLAARLSSLPAASPLVALVQGLTVGVTNDIQHEHWNALRQSGTAHLLAISGLHIGLVSAWFYGLATVVWSIALQSRRGHLRFRTTKQIVALGVGFFSATAYAALAGFSLPTQRALIMLSVFFAAMLARRILPPGAALWTALLIVLLLEPLSVLSVGFWLSFGTVAALFYLHHGRQQKLGKMQSLWLHLKLGFVLLPMTAWFFQQGAVVAPIANALAVPVVGLVVVPLSFLCAVAAFFWPWAANGLLVIIQWILALLLAALTKLLALPMSSVPLFIPGKGVLACLLLGLVLVFAPRGISLRWFAPLLLAPAILFNTLGKPVTGLELHVLDVGQGLSAILLTEHHTVVFDTGKRVSDKSSMVQRVVIPFLTASGRSSVDVTVVSHADDDHAGGLADLLDSFPQTRVYASDEANLIGADSHKCVAGQTFSFDGVVFTFLHPGRNDAGSRNNLSCVLLVHFGKSRILLTGDIEAPAEKQLAERMATELNVDVLIAPHHGSRTSSTAALISVVKPRHVIFPAGLNNKFNFPHTDVQQRYADMGAKSYHVGETGALKMQFDEQGLVGPVEAYWEGRRQFR